MKFIQVTQRRRVLEPAEFESRQVGTLLGNSVQMNTQLVSSTSTAIAAVNNELAWITEREHDLASWLDEVDLELHEQVICGAQPGNAELQLDIIGSGFGRKHASVIK